MLHGHVLLLPIVAFAQLLPALPLPTSATSDLSRSPAAVMLGSNEVAKDGGGRALLAGSEAGSGLVPKVSRQGHHPGEGGGEDMSCSFFAARSSGREEVLPRLKAANSGLGSGACEKLDNQADAFFVVGGFWKQRER